MNPIDIANGLRDSYLRYLETSFHLKDPSLRRQFRQLLENRPLSPLVRTPILEVSPGFKSGTSIQQLINEKVLSSSFTRVATGVVQQALYLHQEHALRKAITEKRNLVVATGTGSGKTEIFLYPILNHLAREYEAGTLAQSGVRALLLYPMNALANDQIARLRQLLLNFPEITFGRYTGETAQDYRAALRNYHVFHDSQEPLVNELISRDQMRDAPPHILFTNYAMLEYLLIRPKDSEIFKRGHWQFIALDEVHTYSGATGIEIAMLLRRLKERVVRSEQGRLQCFATSATLGSGKEDFPKIAQFAKDLFGEVFGTTDVIEAHHLDLTNDAPAWGQGTRELYAELRKAILDSPSPRIGDAVQVARRHVPSTTVDSVLALTKPTRGDQENAKQDCQAFLFSLLRGDGRIQQLRKLLGSEHAKEMTSDLVDLVALGAFAREHEHTLPLIPARYHIMTRAITGIHAWIESTGHLQLLSKRSRLFEGPNGQECAVFEVGSCNRCGEVLLVGIKEEERGITFLRQPPDVGDDPVENLNWYSLQATSKKLEVEEDGAVEEKEEIKKSRPGKHAPMHLCRLCGRIGDAATFGGTSCEDHKPETIELFELENKPKRPGFPRQCPSCLNAYGSVASRILTGKEAPVAVLATSLYQRIPPGRTEGQIKLPGGGRKLMMFSDSRQDAAFFAPFMNNTYNKFKQRRYLVLALEKANDKRFDLEEWAVNVRRVAEAHGEWDESASPASRKRDAARWVLREWIAPDRRLALEGSGVVAFHLRKPSRFAALATLSAAPWELSVENQWVLCQVLLDTIRYQGVVAFQGEGFEDIEITDNVFEPRNFPFYLRGAISDSTKRIYAWEPSGTHPNKRLDYLQRLLARKGIPEDDALQLARAALRDIWQLINHANGPLADLFEQSVVSHDAGLLRLKPSWWQVSLASDRPVLRCNTCGTVASVSVNDVCTMTRCVGAMHPHDKEARSRNHYFNLFTTMTPIPLKVSEHTAQLVKEEAFQTQQDFISGKVNMLSCTTTFEMGVDVGDLQSVFMRNMPPNPGNYVQRAGRAGRRVDTAAVIVTYAQRRTHDLAYFDKWERMVQGAVRPPVLHLDNPKIIRRHIHAEALADYFLAHPDEFDDHLEALFDPATSRSVALSEHLRQHPELLLGRLKRIVPSEKLQALFGLDSWSWLGGDNLSEDLKRETFGYRLQNAAQDVQQDWRVLEDAQQSAAKKGTPAGFRLAGSYASQLETLKRRSLLGKLGTYGLMPKYGFPTEVVELKVRGATKEAGQVELERDMKLALSEFAPGNQVIAAQKVWTARALIMPSGDRKLHEFRYWHCPTCRYFSAEQVVATDGSTGGPKVCFCRKPLSANKYIYPEFGFSTANTPGDRVGDARPALKSYSESFFHDDSADDHFIPLPRVPKVEYRETGQGWIHVINDNRERLFHVCMTCGHVANSDPRFTKTPNGAHLKPWTVDQECTSANTFLHQLALGHRYRTDVLELRLPLSGDLRKLDLEASHSLWLSVLHALVNGSCQALQIDERDIGGCLYYGDSDRPSLILFDTAQGGAGFVREVKENFLEVLQKAKGLLDCISCNEDSSCIACLRTYFNQRDHNRLKRGIAKGYLEANV